MQCRSHSWANEYVSDVFLLGSGGRSTIHRILKEKHKNSHINLNMAIDMKETLCFTCLSTSFNEQSIAIIE